MATLIYAGIGTRATPPNVLADMAVMAGWLARTGWQLSSGGADGADGAFAAGAPAGQRRIWLPWRGYNGHRGPDCRVLSAAAMTACMENCGGVASFMGSVFAGRPQAACQERGRAARRDAGSARRRVRGMDGGRARDRRDGDGHPHRRGPRHTGVQSGVDVAARLDDFGGALTEFANRYWILGAGGKAREIIEALSGISALSETLRDAIRYRLPRPGKDGAPALYYRQRRARALRTAGRQHAETGRAVGAAHNIMIIAGAAATVANLGENPRQDLELAQSAFVLNGLVLLGEMGGGDALWMGTHGNLR